MKLSKEQHKLYAQRGLEIQQIVNDDIEDCIKGERKKSNRYLIQTIQESRGCCEIQYNYVPSYIEIIEYVNDRLNRNVFNRTDTFQLYDLDRENYAKPLNIEITSIKMD